MKYLLIGYSTNIILLLDSCNHYHKKLNDDEVLIYKHNYHFECYQIMKYGCYHCKEYYKYRIYNNVNFFLDRLKKGSNILTSDK